MLSSLTAGLVIGVLTTVFTISLAALIFAGNLSSFVSHGVGLALLGATIAGAVITLFSSYSGIIAAPQEAPAAILALVAAGIANTMPAGATLEATFLTVVAAIAVTSILTGALFLVLGKFELGGLVRFLPYPVIGGFLAGTGWLLVVGAIAVMTDVAPAFATLSILFQADMWLRWLPGLFFAVLLLVVLNRTSHFLIMPGLVLGAMGLFYVVVWLTNTPLAEVSARGWLLGPFPEQAQWRPFIFSNLAQVNWWVIWGQVGNVATILVVSVVALLLNASGLELVVRRDIDLNRELQAAGIGNLTSGLGGGLVGFHLLSESALSYKIGGRGRLVGLVSAAVCGLMLLLGTSLLSLFPKLLLGGMLMVLGLSFLIEWIYRAWFKFSRIDYLIIITILVVIAAVGFLEGVGLGIMLAVVLFVVNYSRINVVKHALSGAEYHSRVTRCQHQRQMLSQTGGALFILQLQGFIFFGTAHNLLDRVRRRAEAGHLPGLRFVVLDFRQVTGLDSTAMLSFARMKQLAQTRQFTLVFTNPAPEIRCRLEQSGICRDEKTVHIFQDLDHGLEWCENQILLAAGVDLTHDQQNLRLQLKAILPDAANLESVLEHFERLDVGPGHYLMKQGDPPQDLYFIESGQVTAQLEFSDREPVRLETMRGGRVVGEIGFYLNSIRTAAVVTDEPSTIYRLSLPRLQQMERTNPEAASTFHQIIIRLLSERLTHLIHTVNALQR
ncbi:MAG: SLC26A/SulP transporter family protein [Anaerolineales bacterium]|nr:MAG: SLC26A/SulP transporter family protein [Anaerolineales bacterium]